MFGESFFSYKFMFVRNPYDRLVSEYKYQNRLVSKYKYQTAGFRFRINKWVGSLWNQKPDPTLPTFSQWLNRSLEQQLKFPSSGDNHFRPQWEFGGEGVEVFKLEDGLEYGLTKIARQISVAPPKMVRRTNTSKNSREIIIWEERDRELVRNHYARDFSEFNYPL